MPDLMKVCSALAKDLSALEKGVESMSYSAKSSHSADFYLAFQNDNNVFIKDCILCRIT